MPIITLELLTYIGWVAEGVIAVIVTIVAGIVLIRDSRALDRMNLGPKPSMDDLRTPVGQPLPNSHNVSGTLERLFASVREQVRQHRSDPEPILAEAHEDIFAAGESVREWSALAIICALLFTFIELHATLHNADADTAFKTAVALVGVNWPGLAAGGWAIFLGLCVRARHRALYDECRRWVEEDILPHVGYAADDLQSVLGQYNETTAQLTTSLKKLDGLPDQLRTFQTNAVTNLAAALTASIRTAPISLSQESLKAINDATARSTELLDKLSRDYYQLVVLTAAEERRQAEMAIAINMACQAVKDSSNDIANFRQSLAALVEGHGKITVALGEVVPVLTALRTDVEGLKAGIAGNTQATERSTGALGRVADHSKAVADGLGLVSGELAEHGERLDRNSGAAERVTEVGNRLSESGDQLHGGISELGETVREGAQRVSGAAVMASDRIGETSEQAERAFAAAASDAAGTIFKAAETAGGTVGAAASGAAGTISRAGADAGGAISAATSRAGETILEAAVRVDQAVDTLPNRLGPMVDGAAGSIRGSVDQFVETVREAEEAIQPNWKTVKQQIDGVLASTERRESEVDRALKSVSENVDSSLADMSRRVDASSARAGEAATEAHLATEAIHRVEKTILTPKPQPTRWLSRFLAKLGL
jgi:hypothetical protein